MGGLKPDPDMTFCKKNRERTDETKQNQAKKNLDPDPAKISKSRSTTLLERRMGVVDPGSDLTPVPETFKAFTLKST